MERGERKGGGREVRRGREKGRKGEKGGKGGRREREKGKENRKGGREEGRTEEREERDGRQRRDPERKGKDLQRYIIASLVPRLSPHVFRTANDGKLGRV